MKRFGTSTKDHSFDFSISRDLRSYKRIEGSHLVFRKEPFGFWHFEIGKSHLEAFGIFWQLAVFLNFHDSF